MRTMAVIRALQGDNSENHNGILMAGLSSEDKCVWSCKDERAARGIVNARVGKDNGIGESNTV